MIAHSRTMQQITAYLDDPAQALGLSGEIGSGKGFVAQYIAEQVIGGSPYIQVADASKDKFGIDSIRELQQFLSLTVPGKAVFRRALIIEHIDSLGQEAQNALLKTLEEPPADTIIIVTCSKETAVLNTIHSRLRRISLLPIDLNLAQTSFPDQDITKAFHLSGGHVGLLCALITDAQDHQLLLAITQAKELLSMTRYHRLSKVDSYVKSDQPSPQLLLDGLYRLLDASYHQAVKTKSKSDLMAMAQRMTRVEQAISDLDSHVQTKLVFTRLFLEL